MNKRVIAAGLSGNVLEWYDFAVYGFFAATIGHMFFPTEDGSASLLLSLGAFAVGFLSRPLGGVLFGYLGDRFGRKTVLVYSTMLMAVPCTLIGLLPGYDAIGIAAPVLLVAFRLLQGASVGGELTGSVTYLFEQAPQGRKAFYASWSIAGAIGGILLGSAVATLITSLLSAEQVAQWGWRIPFLLGAVVGVAGYFLRAHMPDDEVVVRDEVLASPLVTVVRSHWDRMAIGFGVAVMIAVNFYMSFIYLTTYMTDTSGLSKATSLEINTISMVVVLVMILVGGYLADRFGPSRVLLVSSGVLIVGALPLFWMIDHPNFAMAMCGQLGLALIIGPYNGVMAYYIGSLFPKDVRMSGFSVAYNSSFAIFGGTAPMVAQYLVGSVGALGPALYAMAAAIIGFVCVLLARRLEQPESNHIASGSSPNFGVGPDVGQVQN